jgi:hypothetical protein
VPATARPADDRSILTALLEDAFPAITSSGERVALSLKAAGKKPSTHTRRAARKALDTHRKKILALRGEALALTLVDPRAENARRLATESLALLASSVASIEASMGASPKTAKQKLTKARELLGEAIYRGSRAGFLLRP